jgi:hypothetical protein
LSTGSYLKKEDEWASTRVGEDKFEKVPDAPEEKHLTADVKILDEILQAARRR